MATEKIGDYNVENVFYVTFGVQYRDSPHPTQSWANPDGFAVIISQDSDLARDVADTVFGKDNWAFIYDHLDVEQGRFNPDKYPEGCLGLLNGIERFDRNVATTIDGYMSGDYVESWRVVENMAFGTLTAVGDGNVKLNMIQMETTDSDGENRIDVSFRLAPYAAETFIGSLCLSFTGDDDKEAHQKMMQIMEILRPGYTNEDPL